MIRVARSLTIAFLLVVLCSCRSPKTPRKLLHVFAAASLNNALAELEKSFEQKHPDIDVRIEISGSLVAARKVTDYRRRGDIIVAADKRVIETLLIPDFADWHILFVTNEMVLAYSERSRRAAEMSSQTWPQILLDPKVRLARADENLAPLGYQTLLVWKLADLHYAEDVHKTGLFDTLSKKVGPKLVRPDAVELLALLGTEADYIFLYRNMARDHNLKHILLPPEVNLSSTLHKTFYSQASVTISPAPDRSLKIQGEPVLYSLTVLRDSPNRAASLAFITALLSPEGEALLRRHGFSPLSPPKAEGRLAAFPESLRPLVSESTFEAESSE